MVLYESKKGCRMLCEAKGMYRCPGLICVDLGGQDPRGWSRAGVVVSLRVERAR